MKNSIILSLICLVVSFNAGCQSKNAKLGENEPVCGDFQTITNGIYTFENNTWGKDQNLSNKQCLLTRHINGTKQYGWSWDWKGKAPSYVFAYPEVIVGWKPWGGSLPTDPAYPAKISNIKSLIIDYDVTMNAKGDYNLAPEIWIVSQKPKTLPINRPEKLITTEIMFWMDYTDGLTPAGDKIGDFTFDGKVYDLWFKKEHNNTGDTVSWTVYSLVSKTKQHKGRIDVKGLIDTLIKLGHTINTQEFISSVEFGNEIIGKDKDSHSYGTTWFNKYEVTIVTQ